MSSKAEQKRLMVQYLFGDLSAEERAEFEDAYLTDSEFFQELAALENELIDEYILGELSSAERKRFELSFLANPARRETVETAKSLLNYSAAAANAESPEFGIKVMPWHARRVAQLAAAAVFLLLLAAISWLAVNNRKMANELTKLRQERDTTLQDEGALTSAELVSPDELGPDSTNQQMAQAMQDTVPFTLEPGTSRGPGESTTLVVPPHTVYVFLRVVLHDDSHFRYTLSIRTVEGRAIWKQNSLEGISSSDHTKVVAVIIPARRLPDGDCVLRISAGGEDLLHTLAGYSFHVRHKTQ